MDFETIFVYMYLWGFIMYPVLVWLLTKRYFGKLENFPDLKLQRFHPSVRWLASLLNLVVTFMPYANFIAVWWLLYQVVKLKRQARAKPQEDSGPYPPLR